jgi:hypothetical protein
LIMNMAILGVKYMGKYYGIFKREHSSNLLQGKEGVSL